MMVGRPPRDVFAFLADFENVPRWNYAIVETTKASPGPTGVGTRYRQVRQIPRRSQEGFEVTEFVAERRLAIRGRLGPFDSEVAYELEAEGSGTRLVNTVNLRSGGLGRLVERPLAGRIRNAVAENLTQLKSLLESTAP